MNKKKEWENILKAEIILAARELLTASDEKTFDEILHQFDRLYGKLAAYRYLKDNNELDRFFENEKPASEVIPPQKEKSAGKEKEIKVTRETETVSNDTVPKNNDNPLHAHAETFQKAAQTRFTPKKKKQTPPLKLGLADKIAFVRQLFNGNGDLFDAFVEKINEADTYDEALETVQEFKEQLQWDGKDEYEFRLLQLIHAKFSL